MFDSRPLEVLFLTSFSDSCYRSIPALAQMTDELDIRLTILYVYDSMKQSEAKAGSKLRSFFPEADQYGICRRIVMEGEPLSSVQKYCAENTVDLIIAPASDPLGMPRFHKSLRHRLIRECATPVWTMGADMRVSRTHQPTRNVACWVDFESSDKTHLKLAFEYAWKLDAKLHLLHALPEINEGSLSLPLHNDKPLHPTGAAEEIRTIIGWLPIVPEIHVSPSGTRQAMRQLVRECEANVLFLGTGQAIQSTLLGSKLNPAIDTCPCPVVCVDTKKKPVTVWKLERGAAFQVSTGAYAMAKIGRYS